MNSKLLWSDKVPLRGDSKSNINDIAISPDGTRMIVAVGNRILLYNADTGDLLESLRGHKDVVYTVDYCYDGSRFASGGADNIVVIWKGDGKGMLKYTHTAPIQRVKYNPLSIQLASCSDVDYGLWTPEQKQVVKEKVASKILSAAWSTDGTLLAIGMQSGVISIRNLKGDETLRFERKSPIWSLVCIPNQMPTKVTPSGTSSNNIEDTLVVGCWDKTLSFYKIQGTSTKAQSEKQLTFYPCSIALAGANGNKFNYLAIAGSDKKLSLFSRDGIRLSDLASKDSWVWANACNAQLDRVVCGTDSGAIDVIQMSFDNVHALYKDRYAYRENLTEIIVQHLITDKKVRIKCKDLVRGIAIYKNKLAVQLTDRVNIYQSNPDDSTDMHIRMRPERIMLSEKVGEFVALTSNHLLFCSGNLLELYSFTGQRQRVWQFESPVRYMRVDGGVENREGIILGLERGDVLKVYIDNPFPIELTRRSTPVVKVDSNISRTKLSCVDANGVLSVIDLRSQEVIFTYTGVLSSSFNSEIDGTLCFTTTEFVMFVVSGLSSPNEEGIGRSSPNSPLKNPEKITIAEAQEQHTSGLCLGFQGQKIFSLHRGIVSSIDVPQGANMQAALDAGDIRTAYNVACLGATEADWKLLAMRALRGNHLVISKNAFSRLKDTKFLSLIDAIERGGPVVAEGKNISPSKISSGDKKSGGRSRNVDTVSAPVVNTKSSSHLPLDANWQAEILAYEGHHHEAAKVYARAGKIDESIRIFTDLRRWEDAKMFAQSDKSGHVDQSALSLQQAKWLQEINDWKGASELYCTMEQPLQAARIVADAAAASELGWQNVLIEVVRTATASDSETLQFCGEVFSKADEDEFARETYQKLSDWSKLMALFVRRQMWTEAAALADSHEGEFDVSVFLPYAEWLVSQDRYEDAMQAYKKAGRKDLSRKVLEELTFNAVSETRFKDAAYYFWMLSKESDEEDQIVQSDYEHKADLYFAYASVHSYVTDPFTSHQPETLFQVSRFIINSLGSSEIIPYGISKASTLYTLAKQAVRLSAFRLARHAYDRLGKLQLPSQKQEEIELDMLIIQARPVRDDPEHLPVCYRCSSTNPLLNPFTNKFAKGDVCTNCGHAFVRSFINFDILPLVEFVPDPTISDEEAIELIRQPPSANSRAGSKGKGGNGKQWKEEKEGQSDVMTLEQDEDEDYGRGGGKSSGNGGEVDVFARCLQHTLDNQGNNYVPVTVNANTLIAMKRSEIFVCRPSSKNKRATFYRNMLPEITIAISQPCHRFFHLEDFEFAYLSSKFCPYSRLKNVGEYGYL